MLSMSKQYNTKLNNKIYYELVNQQIRFIKSCKKNHINLKYFKEKRD